MKILMIKGDDATNVRLSKYIDFFYSREIPVTFWGWDRTKRKPQNAGLSGCRYLLSGGGFGGKKLLLLYPVWMIVLFFRCLFMKKDAEQKVIAINFDTALPVALAFALRRNVYIYEIHDEFALSYNFPSFVKRVVRGIDHWIMRRAKLMIHVDNNRVNYKKCKTVVIENSPFDYWKGIDERPYDTIEHKFAVIGNISATRGITEICEFAKHNAGIGILVVGKFYNEELRKQLLSLPNVEYHDYMPQQELFKILEVCAGIFSLYDPSLEINRLAASNKVYDAMMLGIPVITNKEVVNSSFIREKNIGFVINYSYDETWEVLSDKGYLQSAVEIGRRARRLYLQEYRFELLLGKRLLPLLEGNTTK